MINKRYDESNGTAGANKIPPTSARPATKDQNAAVSRQEATESHKVLTNPTSSRAEGLMIDICRACLRKGTHVLIGPSIGTIEKEVMESTVGTTRYSIRRNHVVEINTEFLLEHYLTDGQESAQLPMEPILRRSSRSFGGERSGGKSGLVFSIPGLSFVEQIAVVATFNFEQRFAAESL